MTTTMEGVNLALSLMISEQSKIVAPIETSATKRNKREAKGEKAPKPETFDNASAAAIAPLADKSTTTPDLSGSGQRPRVAPPALPAAGSVGPRGFLKLLVGAKDQEQRIAAIAAYVGYNRGQPYGDQELPAKMKASAEIRQEQGREAPIDPSKPFFRNGHGVPSVAGYVAGMPDMTQTRLQNLRMREEISVAIIAEHTSSLRLAPQAASDYYKIQAGDLPAATDEKGRPIHVEAHVKERHATYMMLAKLCLTTQRVETLQGLIAVERERLDALRKDIAALIG